MGGRKNIKGRGAPRGRKKAPRIIPEYEGKVQMTREGYIFVIVEGMDSDVFVKANKTRYALDGDIVRVAVTKGHLHPVGDNVPTTAERRAGRSC